MHQFNELGWDRYMELMIQKFSRDQIMEVCNLFFVEVDYYTFCPKWFYKHDRDAEAAESQPDDILVSKSTETQLDRMDL
jgi:hypothetical protein